MIKLSDDLTLMCADALVPTLATVEATPLTKVVMLNSLWASGAIWYGTKPFTGRIKTICQLGTCKSNISEILNAKLSVTKMVLEMSYAKCWQFFWPQCVNTSSLNYMADSLQAIFSNDTNSMSMALRSTVQFSALIMQFLQPSTKPPIFCLRILYHFITISLS